MARSGADIKTKAPEIVDYWSRRIYEGDLGTDWCDASERCWRCAERSSLERCHIIPAQEPFCGSDSPENFVLLCRLCHEEAPSCSDATEIWAWIKLTKANSYDTYWTEREWLEIKRVYGLDVPQELALRDGHACVSAYKQIVGTQVGLHWRSISIASKVFAWKRVFSQISHIKLQGEILHDE